ncbi:hypothetical protein [Ensifer canadensis]|uniref:hypothetical protein n=1 Tax=Ensifer canadensis TaxID=555315 RepID=UPI0035E3CF2F
MRTGLALAIVLFIAVPLPASAEQGPPLAEPAFAAIAAELRTSAKAREAQIERCTASRTGALPSRQAEFRPYIKQTCARIIEGIAFGSITYARYRILWASDAREMVETLN